MKYTFNGYIEVEVIEEFGILHTVVNEYSPQKVQVIKVSLPWSENGVQVEVRKEVVPGSILLVTHLTKVVIGDEEKFFVKNGDIIQLLGYAEIDSDETPKRA